MRNTVKLLCAVIITRCISTTFKSSCSFPWIDSFIPTTTPYNYINSYAYVTASCTMYHGTPQCTTRHQCTSQQYPVHSGRPLSSAYIPCLPIFVSIYVFFFLSFFSCRRMRRLHFVSRRRLYNHSKLSCIIIRNIHSCSPLIFYLFIVMNIWLCNFC